MPKIAFQKSYIFLKKRQPVSQPSVNLEVQIFCVHVDITSLYIFAFMGFAPRAILNFVLS